jgi:hypothetical protein
MQDYTVQCCFRDTDGRLKIDSKVFESADEASAIAQAKAYFEGKYAQSEKMYSSAKKTEMMARGVSIGGSTSGATIVTGNGNIVSQSGKYNINVPGLSGVHIGDNY